MIGPEMPVEVTRKVFLPVLLTMHTDKVANIRMNVSKTIEKLAPVCKQSTDIIEQFRRILQNLAADQDFDVCFFSQKTMKVL